MTQLSDHFHSSEFACKCCGEGGDKMDPELIKLLERIRSHFGKPVRITSGYRCENHNRAVGGATYSQHRKGTAADFVVDGIEPETVWRWLNGLHIGGLGRYDNFTHIDVRGYRARW